MIEYLIEAAFANPNCNWIPGFRLDDPSFKNFSERKILVECNIGHCDPEFASLGWHEKSTVGVILCSDGSVLDVMTEFLKQLDNMKFSGTINIFGGRYVMSVNHD
jgi:hypothetical protein